MVRSVEDRVSLLLRRPGTSLCDGCLALDLGTSLQEAQAIRAKFEGAAEFKIAEGECSTCRRRKLVLSAVMAA
jgi:hypothetical protein